MNVKQIAIETWEQLRNVIEQMELGLADESAAISIIEIALGKMVQNDPGNIIKEPQPD